jgi:large subunit ribosomal protein L10e
MALRKAAAYSKRKVTPYTRISKRKGKSYIKTVPPQKIVKFYMGATKKKFAHRLSAVSTEKCQVRDHALEACRQFINKQLDRGLAGQYLFKVVPFPHHIQRENKMITGAGADRMQTGMQLSYGKSAGKAAIVKVNTPIYVAEVDGDKGLVLFRKIIKQVQSKMPCRMRIIYEKLE